MAAIGQLSIVEADDLVRFFLARMDMDTRHQLMATMPVHYALAYPDVAVGIIVQHVAEEIAAARKVKGHE